MYTKTSLAFCILALTASCAATPDPEAEKAKHLKPKEEALDVTFTDKKLAESVIGFRAARVTTVIGEGSSGGAGSSTIGGEESVQANCKVQSDGYSAKFQTPAIVNMPSFGTSTKPAKLTCEYDGKSYSQTYEPSNLSADSRTGNALAVGIILCPICGVGMAAANSSPKSGDAYGFSVLKLKVE